MNNLERFGIGIDSYVKANEDIQTDDKKLLTIEYTYLIELFMSCIDEKQKELEKVTKKLKILKDVLDL